MQIPNELYNLLQSLCESLNDILKYPYISPTDKKLERFLYVLEKWRFEIYEQVKFLNDTYSVNEIHFINNEYKSSLKDNVLSLYIPEKLPNLKIGHMVQGFYSNTPHIEVSVLEADKIISFINNNLPNINK